LKKELLRHLNEVDKLEKVELELEVQVSRGKTNLILHVEKALTVN